MKKEYKTSNSELSEKVGKTAKTVKRSLDKLERSGAVTIIKEGNSKVIKYDDKDLDSLDNFIKLTASDKKLLETINGSGKVKRTRRTKAELERFKKEKALMDSKDKKLNDSFSTAFGINTLQSSLTWGDTFALFDSDKQREEYQMYLISEIWLAYAKAFSDKYVEDYHNSDGRTGFVNHRVKDGNEYLIIPYFGTKRHKVARDVLELMKKVNSGVIHVTPMAYIYNVMERAYYAHHKYQSKPYVISFPELLNVEHKVMDRYVNNQDKYIESNNGSMTYYTLGDSRVELLAELWETAFDENYEFTGSSIAQLESIKTFSPLSKSYETLLEHFLDKVDELHLTEKERLVGRDYLTDMVGYANGVLSEGARLKAAMTIYNNNVSYNFMRSGVKSKSSKLGKLIDNDLIDGLAEAQRSIAPDIRGTNNSLEDMYNLWQALDPKDVDVKGHQLYQIEATRVGKPTSLLRGDVSLINIISQLSKVIPLNEYGFVNQDVVIDIDYDEPISEIAEREGVEKIPEIDDNSFTL